MRSYLRIVGVVAGALSLFTPPADAAITYDTRALSGDSAPGTSAGVVYSGFFNPVLNGAGQTVFRGDLTGTGVIGANNLGIWSEGSGTLELVARLGDAAPGTTAGVVYSSLNSSPLLNSAGQTAFNGFLTGAGVTNANNNGIWSEGSGTLALVAREGDAAPGTAAGVVYSNFASPVLNGAGQTAFRGFLTGAGVTGQNRGIWATDPDGLLTLIAREGDLFDVSNDPLVPDLRTINGVQLVSGSGGEGGLGTSFNDAGQLAFHLAFTDGSQGIFVVTVPEPTSVVLLGLGGLTLLRRRTA